jgi:hypothetical protein
MKTTLLKVSSLLSSLFFLLFVSTPLSAGIPEPGIVLYGVVSDGLSGARITSGGLQIIYRDQTTSKAVTNVIALQDLGGVYSYAARF